MSFKPCLSILGAAEVVQGPLCTWKHGKKIFAWETVGTKYRLAWKFLWLGVLIIFFTFVDSTPWSNKAALAIPRTGLNTFQPGHIRLLIIKDLYFICVGEKGHNCECRWSHDVLFQLPGLIPEMASEVEISFLAAMMLYGLVLKPSVCNISTLIDSYFLIWSKINYPKSLWVALLFFC